MKKCTNCNIEFNINDKYCPLCQNVLTGKSSDVLFPKNIRYETNSLILKIILFSSMVLLVISMFLELFITKQLVYSWYTGLGLITNYVIIYFILKNYQNIYRMFGRYGFIVIVLLLIWFMITKSHIITNYVIPSICIFELLFNLIVGIVLRKNYLIKYSRQILMNLVLLVLPMILVLFKLTTNNTMSYICCLFCIISILGLVIFFFDEIKEELQKIFNV